MHCDVSYAYFNIHTSAFSVHNHSDTSSDAVVAFRLAGSNSSKEGRVEVNYRGWWGTVCDDGWTQTNTEVLCRQLTFKYGIAALDNLIIGPGEGPIWLDEMTCSEEETSLADCANDGWGNHNCRHSEDVAVWCSGEQEHLLHCRVLCTCVCIV